MTNKKDSDRAGEPANAGPMSLDEIESFGRDYFASEFPNPERKACPPRAALMEIAHSGSLPDDYLRAHLFSCSDCFNEFRAAVPEGTSVARNWWHGLFSMSGGNLRPALTMIAIVAALTVVAIVVWRKSTEPHRTGSEQAGAPGTPAAAAPSIESSPAAGSSPLSPAVVTTVVDLRGYLALGNVRRDQDKSGPAPRSIRLAAVRTSLRLRLPQGSESGVYTISILDRANLKGLISAQGVSASGESLETTLNLDRLAAKEYVLRIALPGEAPTDYSLVVYSR